MMQMLTAGGLPALKDDWRAPDPSNPRGYFEYEPVKKLANESSWMADARGKAVKVIHRLLVHLISGSHDLRDDLIKSYKRNVSRRVAEDAEKSKCLWGITV